MSHFTCAVITPPPAEATFESLHALIGDVMAPHNEETTYGGWWDWWEIGGRWPRELCVGHDQPHVIAPLSYTWRRPLNGDSDFVAKIKALWQPDQVDACPAAAINWDGMGAMRAERIRVADEEFGGVSQRLEPWQTYRWLTPEATDYRPQAWDLFGLDWLTERDTPAGRDKLAAAERAYSASFRAAIREAAAAGQWVTIVDYHS